MNDLEKNDMNEEQSTDLVKLDDLLVNSTNVVAPPEYKKMLQNIHETMPAIIQDSGNFHKSHSQFMMAMLDVTAITPVRRVKHILAEIHRTKMALEEAHFRTAKSQIELRQLQNKLEDYFEDPLDRELLEIEILEKQVGLKNAENAMQGAIRKMSFFVSNYKNVLKAMGKDHISEEDYEKEEDRYHIMTAMKQALIAARARGGSIDEGNQIYMFDMGINGAQAQVEITRYLQMEQELMSQGKMPTYEMTMAWLEACANRFAGCAMRSAEYRGWELLDKKSLHQASVDEVMESMENKEENV